MSFLTWKLKKELPGRSIGEVLEDDDSGKILGYDPKFYPDFFEFLGETKIVCHLCGIQIQGSRIFGIPYEHHCKLDGRIRKPLEFVGKSLCIICGSYHDRNKNGKCRRKPDWSGWGKKRVIFKKSGKVEILR